MSVEQSALFLESPGPGVTLTDMVEFGKGPLSNIMHSDGGPRSQIISEHQRSPSAGNILNYFTERIEPTISCW